MGKTSQTRKHSTQKDLPPSNVRPAPTPGSYAASLEAVPESYLPLKGDWPQDAYALRVRGDCMAPEMCDGDHVILAPSETLQAGDVAAVWMDRVGLPALKRIASFADGALRLEMQNPPTCFSVAHERIEAVHKVIAVSRGDEVRPIPTIARFQDLPMVRSRGRGRGYDYWAIEAPDDYREGVRYGQTLAFAVAQYSLGRPPRDLGYLLRDIAESQAAHRPDHSRPWKGAEATVIGFWHTIGEIAASGITSVNIAAIRERYRVEQAELDAMLEEERQQDAKARSERARRAALIGASKRRARRKAA
ncbi:S24 family peptidase [Parvibaculum sp.]|uniref:S24 family peptidase n=1 Tax=Parvibaculum sp. TaxID=2024848 RepID=UPI001B1358D6|nr:S24 family peptidase [Parvibaculum sp.]MBO6635993.1 S24 family peptidase [Parvibaculum sp.]MBO6679158.1 S24 family peptidase [Parvibaculum sp.]MBO6685655.1 S24 family peptidase [Parvibaculum sp.]MBO6905790.1 S24 family peptidase [Parvibaculum sp.]